jgi:D-alanyl-D-alanine dipeptidase
MKNDSFERAPDKDLFEIPIPETDPKVLSGFEDKRWKSIPVNELITHEPKALVVVPNMPGMGAMAWPAYYKTVAEEHERDWVTPRGFGELAQGILGDLQTSPLVKVRPALLNMLNQAQSFLDNDPQTNHLQLVVVDGYRRIAVQRRLFISHRRYLAGIHPEADESELDILAQKMVSIVPDDLEFLRKCPPPHSTGGAVDVVLVEKSGIDVTSDYWLSGAVVDFGAVFDEMMHPIYGEERSLTRFYEEHEENEVAKRNRRLLYNVMTEVGFSNYPMEFWHYDFGNQFDALSRGLPEARYGFAAGLLGNTRILEDLRHELAAYFSYSAEVMRTQGRTARQVAHHFGLDLDMEL